jgi:hypothetical protein
MAHITMWEEDYKGNNISPSLQSPLANSSSPSCTSLHGVTTQNNTVVTAVRSSCLTTSSTITNIRDIIRSKEIISDVQSILLFESVL